MKLTLGQAFFIFFEDDMYSIGQLAKKFNLPVSTLRYYDKEGLFPGLERQSMVRKFSDTQVEALRVIECLKKSGLEIREIRQFMEWCEQGSSTYELRLDLFKKRRQNLEDEMKKLEKTMAMVRFKCWYYTEAVKDGSEERLKSIIPNELPPDIKRLYDLSHS